MRPLSDPQDAEVPPLPQLAPAATEPLPFSADLLRAVADVLLATTFDGVWLIDAACRTTFVNHRMATLLGYSIEEMLGRTLFDFMDGASRETAEQNLVRRQTGIAEQHEFRCLRKDGTPIWLLVTANPVLDRAGRYAGALAVIADLSVQKEREATLVAANGALQQELSDLTAAQDALLTLVRHDALTGLYNRRYVEERLAQELARCRRYERELAVLFVDIDHFKSVNDRFGHAIGDQLLCHLATLLQAPAQGFSVLRASDLAARMGGDEIVVLATECGLHGGHTLARRILQALKDTPLVVREAQLFLSVSIGVASFPDHAFTPAELLAAADAAMYRAKQLGGARACLAQGH